MDSKPVVKVEKIHKLNSDLPTKAFVDITILDNFMIKGLRVVKGKDGLFVAMPTEQGRDGKWYETFYALTKEVRKAIENLILEKYNEEGE